MSRSLEAGSMDPPGSDPGAGAGAVRGPGGKIWPRKGGRGLGTPPPPQTRPLAPVPALTAPPPTPQNHTRVQPHPGKRTEHTSPPSSMLPASLGRSGDPEGQKAAAGALQPDRAASVTAVCHRGKFTARDSGLRREMRVCIPDLLAHLLGWGPRAAPLLPAHGK